MRFKVVCVAICIFVVDGYKAETEGKRYLMESTEEMTAEILSLKSSVADLTSKVQALSNQGSAYTRWGRNVCPGTSDLVYKGYTAGKHYTEEGSGSDEQCLPSDPTWSRYVDGNYNDYRARIYGAEIDLPHATDYFPYDVHQQDVPCAVCHIQRPVNIMIPGRTNCYPGWTLEYTGYLMAGAYHSQGSYGHICMDGHPEFIPHGGTNDNQNILFLTEAQCGSLPCPPYVQGRELACVVCSK
ncbi:short-chain collagen C4-like [Mya arenaria]|uniref:short-chain collagen C4-like n=1 Tax=Mya arenaria TaxID=6604 RepID=UPI0022E60430|nr:short-chain collagen C4-like [Mya arenaria]